jgi:hypothetical protein
LLLGQLIAAQARQQHGNAGGVVLEDERWKDAGRQYPQDLLRLGVHLGDGCRDRRVGLEVEPRDSGAPERHGFDVLDPIHRRGECPLSHVNDTVLHLGRRQPGVAPDHADDRNVDARKNVYGHGHDGKDAQDGDQQGQYDERVRPAQCEADNPHGRNLPHGAMYVLRSLRCAGRWRHELWADGVGNRLPHNFTDGFQRSRIQLPASDIRNRRQLLGMTGSPKRNGDEGLI